MEAIAAARTGAPDMKQPLERSAPERREGVGALFPDPLDDDDAHDELVVTTRRAIGRVALVATETAGRFEREGVDYDPMAWMLAPRRVFGGAAAVDACLERDECMRGILIHGLGLGLDVGRDAVDALLAIDGDGDDDAFDDLEYGYLYGERPRGTGRATHGRVKRLTRQRLYTATLAETRDNRMIQAFHASVARNAGEVRARLAGRFGPDLAASADIRPGIHATAPLVIALVPSPVAAMIVQMGHDCASDAARTFAVDIQQVIQA